MELNVNDAVDDLATLFVWYMEGKMEGLLGERGLDLKMTSGDLLTTSEVGEEEGSPSAALCFKGGSISLICGKSSYLMDNDFKPYEETHFNTNFSIAITQAMATFHAMLRGRGMKKFERVCPVEECGLVGDVDKGMEEEGETQGEGELNCLPLDGYLDTDVSTQVQDRDKWTNQVSRPSLVSSNISIMCSNFEHENVSSRVIRKLESLQGDILTFTQFLRFASAMQTESCLQSIGPICMCDIWVPSYLEGEDEGETIVIRLRGGRNLQAPPMRDITWVWLTLLKPEILQERYMELCDSYCNAFNNTIKRLNATKTVVELTLFDIMKDLGDSFLHAFLTLVHKFSLSGVWALDRQLHTSEGVHALAESISFLVDNGIIGSLFIV